jgi:hypothetical protein
MRKKRSSALAIIAGQLKDCCPLAYLRARISNTESGFFEKLPASSVFVALARIECSALGWPKPLPYERPRLKMEPEQKKAILSVQN